MPRPVQARFCPQGVYTKMKTLLQHAQECWETEGIRYLVGGNRVPTPEERFLHAYQCGAMEAEFRSLIPDGASLAAVEIPDDEVE